MKKRVSMLLLAGICISLVACGNASPTNSPGLNGTGPNEDISSATVESPRRTPRLYVSLSAEGLPMQRARAAQLSHNWSPIDAEGQMTRGYCASAEHPLDFWRESWECIDFSAFLFRLDGISSEMKLQFSDDFPPQSISVRRWSTEFIGQACEMQYQYESVGIADNIIRISDDGNHYIYEVTAIWPQGRSSYTFRIDSTS